MKNTFIRILVITVIASASMAFGDSYFEVSRNIDVFSSLFKEVNNYYVDEVEPSKLMRNCIDGMLKTLDPFTNYFSESQIENARIQQGGKFGGIGIEFEIMNGYPVITEVWQNQPADKAGIRAGDIIKSIDGASTEKRSKEDVNKVLIGQPNTNLSLLIEKPSLNGAAPSTVLLNMKREEIQETSVPFYGMITPDVACIKLKIFNENAGKDVKLAFDSLKKANPDMKGLILDLRGNPGGLLNEAVNIVNLFIEKNQLVVTTKGKVDEWNNTFKTLNDPDDSKIPLVMITNSMSASASEIVSGTMQDYDRGVVIGQKTYGKGLVQVTKPLSYNTMLKVTTAKYYIPSGRCIQALNYAEKNADGSVKRIPDSLKVAFKTRGGRKVWDGGGVDPDVVLDKPEHTRVAEALYTQHLIFNWVTDYVLKHNSIEDPSVFHLNDSEYADFISYVKNKKFNYKTDTEEKLDALREATSEEKYFDAMKVYYETIQTKVKNEKEQDLIKNKEEIKTILENEIAGRYYYAYGKVKKSYQNDKEVAKAVELIHSPPKYREILTAVK